MTITSTQDIGVHALVWSGKTDLDSLKTCLENTPKAGFNRLELSLHDGFEGDLDQARALIDQSGLSVSASRGLAVQADVSSEDPQIVTKGQELIAESIRITAALGGDYLTGALYGAFGKASSPLSAKGRANVVGSLKEMAPEAEAAGITLGLEVCNRYETNVVNTAEEALRLADDVGSDNLLIHLDTYHMNIEESDLVRPVELVADRLGYVHIGENTRGYLASGMIDFPRFFSALTQIDYEGPIVFESFSRVVVMEKLSNDLAIWRNLWSDSMDLATHANRMIRSWQTPVTR